MATNLAASVNSANKVQAYQAYGYKEEEKGAPVQEASPTASLPSSGSLHPSILSQDALRRQQIRPNLFTMVIRRDFHHPAVRQLQAYLLPSKANYIRYLVGLREDIGLIEAALKKNAPKELPSLDAVYRSEAIEADLKALGLKDELSFDLTRKFGHTRYLASIADQPHRLIAHLAVHHLGFMYGGQATAKTLKGQDWGKNAASLYQFTNLSALLPGFSKELTQYLHGLPEAQYKEFETEMSFAWIFACDVSNLNMRKTV